MTNYDEFEMNRCTYLYGVRTAKTSFRHWHVCTTCEQPANKRYQTEQIICCAQTLFRPHKHSAFVSAAFTLTRPSACDSSVLTYLRRCDVRVIGSRCFLFISINIFSLSATIASVSFFFFFFFASDSYRACLLARSKCGVCSFFLFFFYGFIFVMPK